MRASLTAGRSAPGWVRDQRPAEAGQDAVEIFYRRLLAALRHPIFHDGVWQPLKPTEEWAGNPTHRHIVAHRWSLNDDHPSGFCQPVA